jgi:HD-GYP domain-containing protein (c-di-GMP phosphodiesterase class II)
VAALAHALLQVRAGDAPDARDTAVRGLLALNAFSYRGGSISKARVYLHIARELMHALDASLRCEVLLRSAEMETLAWDVGAALQLGAAAMEVARSAGSRADEARSWTVYGIALQAAGLAREADARFVHALELLGPEGDARALGNIWQLRTQITNHHSDADYERAHLACAEALRHAERAQPRYRDSMACTALCNTAALAIIRGHVDEAADAVARASALPNLGVRPKWLLDVLRALMRVRHDNTPEHRAGLEALLAPRESIPRAYVLETYSIMASVYAAMGDADDANAALSALSVERCRALMEALADPIVWLDTPPSGEATAQAASARMTSPDMLERLAVTAELRDDITGKHCFRVGRLSLLIAEEADMPAVFRANLEAAARLHDIGKIAIPDAILLKPGRLTPAEREVMQAHATIGADLLKQAMNATMKAAECVARHHHERWDGTGYPAGLVGEAIPLEARVVAIADVFDALTHARPYKSAWTRQEATRYIVEQSGRHFDPALVESFLRVLARFEMLDEAHPGVLERELERVSPAALIVPLAVPMA